MRRQAKICPFYFSASVIALIALQPGQADAQDAGAQAPARVPGATGSLGPSDIIVTARRREENVQKVPVAVSVISGAKIERLVINSASDINKLASGISASGCSTQVRGCTPYIRGQGTSFGTSASSVISYFAEVPNFLVSYMDLQNVQVLKGPQGTLFGETATGGAVLYTPTKPTNDFSGYAGVQLGDYNYRQFDAAVGGAIVPDKIMFRIAARYRKREGFTTEIFSDGSPNERYDNLNEGQWRISLVLKPTETLENYTMYAGYMSDINGPGQPVRATDPRFLTPQLANLVPASIPSMAKAYEFETGTAPPPGLTYAQIILADQARQNAVGRYVAYTNFHSRAKDRYNGFVNQTKWEIGDNVTFRNIFGLYFDKASGGGNNVDGVDAPLVDVRNVRSPGSNSAINNDWAYVGGWPNRTWSNETQLLGKALGGRLDWQAGVYYRRSAVRDWGFSTPPLVAFGNNQGDPATAAYCASTGVTNPCTELTRNKSTTYGAYGQATYTLFDNLRLTAGYRHTWDTTTTYDTAAATRYVSFMGTNFPQYISGTEPIPGAKVISYVYPLTQANTYTISADWRITNKLLVYVAHRTGYKQGGINFNAPPGDPDQFFQPEHIKDVEIGVKADWSLAGIHGRTNVAIYKDWYTDMQRTDILPGSALTLTTNSANSTIQGVELDNTMRIAPWFELTAYMAYTDAKFTSWLETTTCGSQFWRPQCAGIATSTQFTIDHAHGVITGLGSPIHFKPDGFRAVPKWSWSIQPTIMLKPLIGREIELSANLYRIGGSAANDTNTSILAGVGPLTTKSVFGKYSNPFYNPGYTLLDLGLTWYNIGTSGLTLSVHGTNVTNRYYNLAPSLTFTTTGTAGAVNGAPRMWYAELRYKF